MSDRVRVANVTFGNFCPGTTVKVCLDGNLTPSELVVHEFECGGKNNGFTYAFKVKGELSNEAMNDVPATLIVDRCGKTCLEIN